MYKYQPYQNHNLNQNKVQDKKIEKKEDALFKFDENVVNDGAKPKDSDNGSARNTEKYSGVYMPPILISGGENKLKHEKKDEQ